MTEILSNNSDAYSPVRAETSSSNPQGFRYSILDIPINWSISETSDFFVVAISSDGQIVENLSSAYLSYDNANNTLTVAPVFGEKDFCVYVFRNEEAANLFAIKADGNASLTSILAQFEKDNRVLKQLQASQGRSIRTPDVCGILPEANFRKNKILEFDANGNPATILEAQDYRDVKSYRDDANTSRLNAAQIKNETQILKDETQALKNTTQALRDTTQTLKNDTQAVKDAAQVLLDNAIEITDPDQWRRDTRTAIATNTTAIATNTTDIQSEREKFIPFVNVAALKASTILREGSVATTLGYYSANDGGGADYVIVDDSSLTDDGGSILAISSSSLRAKLIVKNDTLNAKQFGAKADFSGGENPTYTDNSAVFSKMISCATAQPNSAFLFYVPSGKYAVCSTIGIPSNCNVCLDGDIYYIASNTNRTSPAIRISYAIRKKIFINNVFAVGDDLENWSADDVFAGVDLISLFYCSVHIMGVTGFATGVRCIGKQNSSITGSEEFNWNNLYLSMLANNKTNLLVDVDVDNPSSINSNVFEGGSISASNVPSGFTGIYYGIKTCKNNSNIFRNFDITGSGASDNSEYLKYHIYLNKSSYGRYDNLRWECGVNNEKNKLIVVNCESTSTASPTGHSYMNRFIHGRYGANPSITFINEKYALCSLVEVAKTELDELEEKTRFRLFYDRIPLSVDGSNRKVALWKGALHSHPDYAKSNLTSDCNLASTVGIWDYNVSSNTLLLNSFNAVAFLFKLKRANESFLIKGDGNFRTSVALYDSDENVLRGNVIVQVPVSVDGAEYGTYVGSFEYLGGGAGIVTPNDTSITPFAVTCTKVSGSTINSETSTTNRIWSNSDSSISGTFASPVVALRRRMSGHFIGSITNADNSPKSERSFTIYDPDAKFVLVMITNSVSSPVENLKIYAGKGTDLLRYPNKWAHIRFQPDRFYSTSKPTSTSVELWPIEDGAKVYSAASANSGKFWKYSASSSSWSELQS